MLSEGKGKLSLFNIQSDIDKEIQQMLAPDYKDFTADNVPEWFTSFERAARKEMSFQNESIPPVPSPEDFFAFPFRHISATIVGGGTYKATDFSKEVVLRRSTELLTNVPAYTNHYLEVGREIGFIGEATFRKKYTNKNGSEIPAGIEAPFIIDSILHGDLVRKMNSPVSPIDSASVTVIFNWVASHEFEDERDFYWHIGEVIDDEMVRREVEEIVQYEESSLVWAGADPYAKMLDENGQVVNIDRAGVFAKNKFSDQPELRERDWAKKYFIFDCLDKSKWLHLSKSVGEFSKTNDTFTMNKELLKLLASFFKTTPESFEKGTITKEDIEKFEVIAKEDYTKVKENASKYESEVAARTTAENTIEANKPKVAAYDKIETLVKEDLQIEELDKGIEEIKGLVTFKKENEVFAKQGKSNYESLKKKAKDTYSSFANGKPDEAIVKKIDETTDPKELESFITMWGGKLATEFKAVCTTCDSSENIKFQKSETKGDEEYSKDEKEEHLGMATRV